MSGICTGIAGSTVEALAKGGSRSFRPGDDLFTTDQPVQGVLHIRSGRVRVWRLLASGQSVTMCHLREDDVPGLPACVQQIHIPVNVTAASDVEVDVWPADAVRRLLHADPAFASNVVGVVSRYVRIVGEALEDHVGAVEGRLCRALLRLAAEHGEWRSGDEPEVSISRQELADLTGSTLSTASRTLSAWERQGYVRSRRRRVVLTDLAALSALADAA